MDWTVVLFKKSRSKKLKPAEPVALGPFEDFLKQPEFFRQVPQIPPPLLLVRESQDDHWQLGHFSHFSAATSLALTFSFARQIFSPEQVASTSGPAICW